MTNTEIIQAAFKVWGRDFYINNSLNQVALELGVSKPALYRHFRNKQALLDAMTEHFFNDFTDFIRADYEKALSCQDNSMSLFVLIRVIAEYFADNIYIFIFSLVKLNDHHGENRNLGGELRSRGIDIGVFHQKIANHYLFNPLVMQMVFTTLSFYMMIFHKQCKSLTNPPSKEVISQGINEITGIIRCGLGYDAEKAGVLDYEELENRVIATMNDIEDDPLLKAVAGAVAEAGPWEASMEQIARRSGLSKSSLYGHFRNKQDMLRRLFTTEFLRIIGFARQSMGLSAVPGERLYLGIFSIAEYLRSRPDILVALDWVRTRRLDLKKNKKSFMKMGRESGPPREFSRLFEDIGIDGDEKERQKVSHWILFLIINILMRPGGKKQVKNEDIRLLYRFMTLGIGGFLS